MALDGEDLSGRYLLWHAMNLRSVGPVLALAPNAKTNDRVLDFVGAREDDRMVLLEYFEARAAGERRKFPLPAKRFVKMQLRWNKSLLHFDDETWPQRDGKQSKPVDIEIEVKDAALAIWRID